MLEIIKAGVDIPPGSILFEDPPTHDIHRSLLSRVFTPKQMSAHRARGRASLRRVPRPARRERAGSISSEDLGGPDADADDRDAARYPRGGPGVDPRSARRGIAPRRGRSRPSGTTTRSAQFDVFSEYIDWRADHPSDDLMTELLNAEFEDDTGTRRTLTHEEILGYVGLLAGAGNETTTRLIGLAGEVLAEHPDQRAELVDDRTADPQRDRRAAALRGPVAGPVALCDPGRRAPRPDRARGQRHGDAERLGQPGRAPFDDPDRFDIHRDDRPPPHLRLRPPFLPRRCPGPARRAGRVGRSVDRFPEWEVDYDQAKRARTSTVRGWETLPARTS